MPIRVAGKTMGETMEMENDWYSRNIIWWKKIACGRNAMVVITHSMPSINGVSVQSLSGNRCKIFPLRFPDPIHRSAEN